MTPLFWRLMVLACFNRDIDQKQVVGTSEFILTPCSLLTPHTEVLPCRDKLKLMHLRRWLPRPHTILTRKKSQLNLSLYITSRSLQKDYVFDGMVVVQKLPAKVLSVETVKEISASMTAS